jgi:predicted acetyltransferase
MSETAADITIRPLDESDLDELIAIREVAFRDRLSRTNEDVRQKHVDTLDYKFGLFVDGKLASSASWYPFSAFLHGKPTDIWGLASVISDPGYRRRGYVGDLLEHGLAMLRDRGATWCLEYPFDTRFYRKYGWHTVANGAFFEVPPERLAEYRADPNARRLVDIHDDDRARIARIYEAWASGFNFTLLERGEPLGGWSRILEPQPWSDEPRYTYVMEEAYAVLHLGKRDDEEVTSVIDYAYATPRGRHELLGFLGQFRGQSDLVSIQLPADDPLTFEWSNFVVPHPHPLHARIVDVREALGELPSSGLDLVLSVRDDLCDWNDGHFRVRSRDGGTVVDETSDEHDLSVDIRDLARAMSGTVRANEAIRSGALDGPPALVRALLDGVERRSHMPLSDYF